MAEFASVVFILKPNDIKKKNIHVLKVILKLLKKNRLKTKKVVDILTVRTERVKSFL